MKLFERTGHYLFLKRVAAVLLTVAIMAQTGVSFAGATASGILGAVSPIIYLQDKETEIDDGMQIDAGGYLYARYVFTASLNDLAGVEGALALPERMRAAYAMSETITGTDARGNKLPVGTLTIDADKSVKVSFFDLPDDSEDAATSGGTDHATGVDTASGGGTATSGGTDPAASIDPNEEITVDFYVPVTIDTTGLTLEDGGWKVTLESGGETVTVTIPAPDAETGATAA